MVCVLGLALAVPYLLAYHLAARLAEGQLELELLVHKHVYPCLLLCVAAVGVCVWQCSQLRNLFVKIRNDHYLIGRKLVNYVAQHSRATSL